LPLVPARVTRTGMTKVVSIRNHALLPFPERELKRGYCVTIASEPAADKRFIVRRLLFSNECIMHLRIRLRNKTSGKWVSADLAERVPFFLDLKAGQVFEMEVHCLEDCVLSAALCGEWELPLPVDLASADTKELP